MASRRADARTADLHHPALRYFNRELSWLEFNSRVLELAHNPAVPLLERVKFCAIFAGNLDEFYEVRVAGLKDQQEDGDDARGIEGRRPSEQLVEISKRVRELTARLGALFHDELLPALVEAGIQIVGLDELDAGEAQVMQEFYDSWIFPVLTPLSVDPSHPFPYISNLSLNLATIVRDPNTGQRRFARVKVPPLLPRFVPVQGQARMVPIEQLIAAQLESLFPGMEIEASHTFRVTRNVDLDLDDEATDDLLEAVESELRRRRFGNAVRLEVEAGMPQHVFEMLAQELELEDDDVTVVDGLLDLSSLWSIYAIDRPELKDVPWVPRTQARLSQLSIDGNVDLFAEIRRGDVLVHHPYESFTTSVERFIQQAAADPDVLTIKLTLYRTSGDSPIARALIDAVERGKQVAAVVELKARFDEQANIAWARALEQAGVHVVYGLVGLKTHTKVALVVRAEGDGLRRYCHVATGNYNPSTARLYEDLGLFSADPVLGADLSKLFNSLTGYSRPVEYERLLVAPATLRTRMIELIQHEHAGGPGGAPGRIEMKMNSLVDQRVIEALYAASSAGVEIDLSVRGICCLRPGVPGLSERIRVRSIVGRFLEHSRIYVFANGQGPGQPLYLIGSADMMPRNLDLRVEAVTPVLDDMLTRRLREILDLTQHDNVRSWRLGPDGTWTRREPQPGEPSIEAHLALQRRAVARSG